MMRVYAELGHLAYDNSRAGDLTSPSYMELQKQTNDLINSISGQFKLAKDPEDDVAEGRHKSTDHKAVIRKIFTKMKPQMNIKVIPRTSISIPGQEKKDVNDIPVNEAAADGPRRTSILQ